MDRNVKQDGLAMLAAVMVVGVALFALPSEANAACGGRKAPLKCSPKPRSCGPRHDHDCGPRWGMGFSFALPTSQPRPYIAAPTQPSVLSVGNTVYCVDGGGAAVVAAPPANNAAAPNSDNAYNLEMAERYAGYAEQERKFAQEWKKLADKAREYAEQTDNPTARQMWLDTAASHDADAARHNRYADEDQRRADEYRNRAR